MISHKYKCIFIHIPRTAGTFTELLIDGKDWWVPKGYGSFRQEKHIIASQAKKIYKDYWDEYFKFSMKSLHSLMDQIYLPDLCTHQNTDKCPT